MRPFSPSRRLFLKGLVGTAALLGVGGLWGKNRFTAAGGGLPALRYFSATQAATLLGVYETLFSEEERKRYQGGASAFLTDAEAVMDYYPPYLRQDFLLALSAVNLSPLFSWRLAPFFRLSTRQRLSVLRQLDQKTLLPLHLAQAAAREMTGFLHLGNPGVWPHIGYEGPMVN